MRDKLPSFNRLRVLVVEDNPLVRQVSIGLLRILNCETIEAGSGIAALKIFQSGTPVDLLFTDIVMPGNINGFQLAELARYRQPGLKVLFTSGYSEENRPAHAGHTAGYRVLTKPFSLAELSEALLHLLPQAVIPARPSVAVSA